MRKKDFLTLVFLLNFAVLLSACNPFVLSGSPTPFNHPTVEIKSTTIDNSYNNTKVTQGSYLAQIDDRLYYHYENTLGEKSDYIITNNHYEKSDENLVYDFIYDGQLLDMSSVPFKRFDSITGKYSVYDRIQIPTELKDYSSAVCNGTLFLESEKDIYRYNGKTFELWATWDEIGRKGRKALYDVYIDGDCIYYSESDEENEKTTIYQYNNATKKIESLETKLISPSALIENDGCVYYELMSGALYKADFNNKTVKQVFDDTAMIWSINMYKDTVCLCVESDDSGIYVSEKNGNFKKICDFSGLVNIPNELYIVDETYFYYIVNNGYLYRVTRDGSQTEQVF